MPLSTDSVQDLDCGLLGLEDDARNMQDKRTLSAGHAASLVAVCCLLLCRPKFRRAPHAPNDTTASPDRRRPVSASLRAGSQSVLSEANLLLPEPRASTSEESAIAPNWKAQKMQMPQADGTEVGMPEAKQLSYFLMCMPGLQTWDFVSAPCTEARSSVPYVYHASQVSFTRTAPCCPSRCRGAVVSLP